MHAGTLAARPASFADYEKVERDYYKRTGIFPIMHTVVIRRELLKEHPGIAEVVYKGFCDAKKAAEDKYRLGLIFNNMDTMFPCPQLSNRPEVTDRKEHPLCFTQ